MLLRSWPPPLLTVFFFLFLHFILFCWLTTRYDVDAAAAGSATPRTDGSAAAADVVVVDDDVVASTHTHIRAGCTKTHTIHFPYTFIYARLLIPAATKIRRFLRFLPKIFFFSLFSQSVDLRFLLISTFFFLSSRFSRNPQK